MAGILNTNILTQVGFIVKDIDVTKRKFAEFFGVAVPPNIDGGKFEITGTTVNGEPAPDANCLMAFFPLGNGVTIELIQPNGVKSTWQDHLDTHGEGIHHIAFEIKGMDGKVADCESFGMKCVQRGKYGNAGGEYAYMDASGDLKCLIELLENY